MKERPIPFNTPMVRAMLEGRKTQTRRPAENRKHPDFGCDMTPAELQREDFLAGERAHIVHRANPFGQPGDRLWVRESARVMAVRGGIREIDIEYQADSTKATVKYPSRLAPAPLGKLLSNGTYREASRILLEITAVRVDRLQDISETDAIAEGVEHSDINASAYRDYLDAFGWCSDAVTSYRTLWESINGDGSWDANPWVWVIEFKRVQP